MRGILIKLLFFSVFTFNLLNPHSVMAISSELNQGGNNNYIPSSGGSTGTAPPDSSSNGGNSVPPLDDPVPPGNIDVIIEGSITTETLDVHGDKVIDIMDLIRLEKKDNDGFSLNLFLDWVYGKKISDL
ncbi:hypothetical protein [Robertmurraya sp.]|uniref:hypothetical protein n=1 Tax=Robertmurraya sp. TaxID=2837525 RepID=UPI003704BE43